jgi:hypothetical protein
MVLNSLMLFILFNGNLCNISVQLLNVTIFLAVWQEILFILMPEVIGFLHIYISVFPYLFEIF